MRVLFTVLGAVTLLTSGVGFFLYSPPGSGLLAAWDILHKRRTDSKTWMITASERFVLLALAIVGLRVFQSNLIRLNTPISFSSVFDQFTAIFSYLLVAIASSWRLAVYLRYRFWPSE